MKRIKINYFAVLFVMAVLSVQFYFLFTGYAECNAIGGDYVRSVFWFKCI